VVRQPDSSRLIPYRIQGDALDLYRSWCRSALIIPRPSARIPERVPAGVVAVDVEGNRAVAIGGGPVLDDNVSEVVSFDVRRQLGATLALRFEGDDVSGIADQQPGKNREEADVGADVCDDVARLQYSKQNRCLVRLVEHSRFHEVEDQPLVGSALIDL
jgi:hypothetical protein